MEEKIYNEEEVKFVKAECEKCIDFLLSHSKENSGLITEIRSLFDAFVELNNQDDERVFFIGEQLDYIQDNLSKYTE